jgi:hypothetical protein
MYQTAELTFVFSEFVKQEVCWVMDDAGHPQSVHMPLVEENILNIVGGDPSLSTRRVSV